MISSSTCISKILLAAASAVLICHTVAGQGKAVGSIWSYKGISMTYSQTAHEDSFYELALSADMMDLLNGNSRYPGVAARFAWNIILKDSGSAGGGCFKAYVGPGAIMGWTTDKDCSYGILTGISTVAGLEYISSRKIAISVSVSPILGCHTVIRKDMIQMKLYRNGLIGSLIPEACIKYYF